MRKITMLQINLSTREVQQKIDFIAEEKPLHIFLNQTHYSTILCTPENLKELVLGHLLSEGVLARIGDIKEILLEKNGICKVLLKPDIKVEKVLKLSQPFARLIVSTCDSSTYWSLSKLIDRLKIPKVPSKLTVKAKAVSEAVKQLNFVAENFRKTGGVHVAALCNADGEILVYMEDVGRHNAVDKVVGAGALNNWDFQSCILTSSGRLTGDVVLKAARIKIPIVASLSAVIDSAIEVAQLTGVTLAGFVRGKRINVYTYPERIVMP